MNGAEHDRGHQTDRVFATWAATNPEARWHEGGFGRATFIAAARGGLLHPRPKCKKLARRPWVREKRPSVRSAGDDGKDRLLLHAREPRLIQVKIAGRAGAGARNA